MKFTFNLLFAIILLYAGDRNCYAENLNKVYTPTSKLIKVGIILHNQVKVDSIRHNQSAQSVNNTVSGKINKPIILAREPAKDHKNKLDTSSSDSIISSSEENQSRSELDDTKNQRLNKISFYKIGFTLTIFGFVVGFMFGRAAFLIATTGIIFLIIGYFI